MTLKFNTGRESSMAMLMACPVDLALIASIAPVMKVVNKRLLSGRMRITIFVLFSGMPRMILRCGLNHGPQLSCSNGSRMTSSWTRWFNGLKHSRNHHSGKFSLKVLFSASIGLLLKVFSWEMVFSTVRWMILIHRVLRLVAPPKLRTKIFLFLHDSKTGGHLGITKTVSSAKQRFWWPGMKADVKCWCQYCDCCQRRNLRQGPKHTTLHQEPVGSPMERVAFDILSFPEETDHGNKVVLVICDYFTKWTEAVPLKDHQASTVADALITQFFLRLGFPRIIHSDQAPEFTSELMQELCQLLEIHQSKTCPYRPQSDGLVERFNCTLIDMLSKFCGERCDDWDDHLPYL